MLQVFLQTRRPSTLVGKAFKLKSAVPHEISYPPRVILDVWRQVFDSEQMIEPPSANGTIAGGVLTLTFAATIKTKCLGVKYLLSTGDQTALSIMTFTVTRVDLYGQNVVQTFSGTPTSRSAEIFQIFSSMSGNIAKPEVYKQGRTWVGPGPVDMATNLVIGIAGPTGMEVSAELMNAKHPDVKNLFDARIREVGDVRSGIRESSDGRSNRNM